jgi:hypothetical protein
MANFLPTMVKRDDTSSYCDKNKEKNSATDTDGVIGRTGGEHEQSDAEDNDQ